MALNISYKTNGNEFVIKVTGQINILNAAEFEKELFSAIQDQSKDFVLDFTGLEFISSAGLSVLLLCAKNLVQNNKKFTCLLSSDSRIKDIFRLTGFYSVINIEEGRKI